ncbi:MAG TPA: hypothetical protein VFU88_20885 [Ktedonobacterales bacterium]|jgi:hypothetical protein|nr:hypothetical protein [Ktedonobacterales bacterium]
MDQLVNMVAQRAGISSDQAQKAVQTVLGFLKDKLPGPIASQLDSVVGGQGTNVGQMGQQAMGGVGDMFGGGQPGQSGKP